MKSLILTVIMLLTYPALATEFTRPIHFTIIKNGKDGLLKFDVNFEKEKYHKLEKGHFLDFTISSNDLAEVNKGSTLLQIYYPLDESQLNEWTERVQKQNYPDVVFDTLITHEEIDVEQECKEFPFSDGNSVPLAGLITSLRHMEHLSKENKAKRIETCFFTQISYTPNPSSNRSHNLDFFFKIPHGLKRYAKLEKARIQSLILNQADGSLVDVSE